MLLTRTHPRTHVHAHTCTHSQSECMVATKRCILAHTRFTPTNTWSKLQAERVRAMYLTERKWPHLSGEEVARHIVESEERRRVQDLRMPAVQYELEKKWVRVGK